MVHALAALVLAVAPAGSAPAGNAAVPAVEARGAPEGAPLRLATPEDVARLCRALAPPERLRPAGDAIEQGAAAVRGDTERAAALSARYEIVVPAAKLPFAPYDGPERQLALSEPVQLPVADGTVRVWPTEDRALAVQADAPAARRILDAQRNGALTLAVVFALPDDASCATGARGKSLSVPIEPISWRWVEGDTVLAAGGAAAERPLAGIAQGARPRVAVGEPLAGPADAKKAVLARSADLEACYAEALKRDPGIDGVLVADIGGQKAAISADSVGDVELAACVQRVLGPLAAAQGGKVAVPIRFELEPPGAAPGAPPERKPER